MNDFDSLSFKLELADLLDKYDTALGTDEGLYVIDASAINIGGDFEYLIGSGLIVSENLRE